VRDKMKAQGFDMMPPEPSSGVAKLVRGGLALWVPIIKASEASAEYARAPLSPSFSTLPRARWPSHALGLACQFLQPLGVG
jgi:hypothetical protein